MTLDGCGKPQVIADGLTVLITDGLPMRRPAVHESESGTLAKWRPPSSTSVYRATPEVTARVQGGAFDPFRKSSNLICRDAQRGLIQRVVGYPQRTSRAATKVRNPEGGQTREITCAAARLNSSWSSI